MQDNADQQFLAWLALRGCGAAWWCCRSLSVLQLSCRYQVILCLLPLIDGFSFNWDFAQGPLYKQINYFVNSSQSVIICLFIVTSLAWFMILMALSSWVLKQTVAYNILYTHGCFAIFQIKMAENKGCTLLCQPTPVTAEQSTKLSKLILEEYYVHMYVVFFIWIHRWFISNTFLRGRGAVV